MPISVWRARVRDFWAMACTVAAVRPTEMSLRPLLPVGAMASVPGAAAASREASSSAERKRNPVRP